VRGGTALGIHNEYLVIDFLGVNESVEVRELLRPFSLSLLSLP
jgi:hypothetical protein